MTDELKDKMILKALYAAADELINEGVLTLSKVVTASQLANDIYKAGALWTDNLPTTGAHDGYYIDLYTAEIKDYDSTGIEMKEIASKIKSIQINLCVDSFRCTVPASSLFQIIRNFEKICGISSAKAKQFAPKAEDASIVVKFEVTKQIKDLAAFCDNNEIRPILNGVFIDIKNAVAVASDGHVLQVCPCNMVVTGESLEEAKDSVVLPKQTVKALKAGDVVTVLSNGDIVVNDVKLGQIIDGIYPNWQSCFYVSASVANKWHVAKDFSKIKKIVRNVKKFASMSSELIKFDFSGAAVSIQGKDYDFSKEKTEVLRFSETSEENMTKRIVIGFKASNFLKLANVENLFFSDCSCAMVYTSKGGVLGLLMPWLINDGESGAQGFTTDKNAKEITAFGFSFGQFLKDDEIGTGKAHVDVLKDIEIYTGEYNNKPQIVALPSVYICSGMPSIYVANESNESDERKDNAFVSVETKEITATEIEPLYIPYIATVESDENKDNTFISVETQEDDTDKADTILLRRIFALAASYIIVIVLGVTAISNTLFADTVKASQNASNSVETTKVDILLTDTVKASQDASNSIETTKVDTLLTDTVKASQNASNSVETTKVDTLLTDTVKASQNTSNNVETTKVDTLLTDTVKASQNDSNSVETTKVDTLLTDTVKASQDASNSVETTKVDTLLTDTVKASQNASNSIETTKVDTLLTDMVKASQDASNNSDNGFITASILPLLLIIGPRKNHRKQAKANESSIQIISNYMSVQELSDDQREELKFNLYYGDDMANVTPEEQTVIDNAAIWQDIPDDILNSAYSAYSFVNDDFACSAGH